MSQRLDRWPGSTDDPFGLEDAAVGLGVELDAPRCACGGLTSPGAAQCQNCALMARRSTNPERAVVMEAAGASIDEIAAELGVAPGRVRVMLRRSSAHRQRPMRAR